MWSHYVTVTIFAIIYPQFSPALVRFLPSKGDQWEMVSSHFKVGAKLGEGNYGQVYKGTLSEDVATAPSKVYIAKQTKNGKQPYTVAIKLLKGVQHTGLFLCYNLYPCNRFSNTLSFVLVPSFHPIFYRRCRRTRCTELFGGDCHDEEGVLWGVLPCGPDGGLCLHCTATCTGPGVCSIWRPPLIPQALETEGK